MGGDGRDGRGAQRGVGGRWGVGGWDDRLGRPTPERFHKSRVSKQGSVCGNQGNLKEACHLLARSRYCTPLGESRMRRLAPHGEVNKIVSVSCYNCCQSATVHLQLNVTAPSSLPSFSFARKRVFGHFFCDGQTSGCTDTK